MYICMYRKNIVYVGVGTTVISGIPWAFGGIPLGQGITTILLLTINF